MLDALGLDEAEMLVYRSVLGHAPQTGAELVAATGLDAESVGRAIESLESTGLIARQASDSERFTASPPSVALRPVVREHESRLADAHEAIREMSELYRRGASLRAEPDAVDVVVGADAVRQRIGQLQSAAEHRVRAMVLAEVLVVSSADNVEEDQAVARGVEYRVLVERAVIERPGFLAAADEAIRNGERIRTRPALPTRMFIADDAMALVPLAPRRAEEQVGALLVHPSGLLDLVSHVFEEEWSRAGDLGAVGSLPSPHDAVDAELLRFLLLGMTDAAAGAALGISARTVQRRVADLLTTARVATRMQLGAEAVRRGWV